MRTHMRPTSLWIRTAGDGPKTVQPSGYSSVVGKFVGDQRTDRSGEAVRGFLSLAKPNALKIIQRDRTVSSALLTKRTG